MSKRAYTRIGLLAAGSGTFLWGLGPVFVKLTSMPFLVLVLYRHLISLPVFVVAWLLTRDRASRLPWRVAAVGGVLFALHQMSNFAALRYSTAAVVTIFFSLQPILVGAIGHRVTGERTTRRFYVWAGVAVAGCAFLVLASAEQPHASALGTVLAASNLFLWSAYYLATKRARATVGTVPWMLVMTIVSGSIVAVIALITRAPVGSVRSHDWLYLVLLGIFPGAVGHLLVTWAHPQVHAAASSVMILAVPIVGTLGAAIFAHEPFSAWEALGVAIAVVAASIAMRHLPAPVAVEAAEHFGEVAT
jgi:drug/metabolite transporter (DMT)-like permease